MESETFDCGGLTTWVKTFRSFQSVEKLKPRLQTIPITLVCDCGASLKLQGCINPLLSNPATCWDLGYSRLPHNMTAWCAAHTQTSIRERLPCAAAGWVSSWLQKRQRVKTYVRGRADNLTPLSILNHHHHKTLSIFWMCFDCQKVIFKHCFLSDSSSITKQREHMNIYLWTLQEVWFL